MKLTFLGTGAGNFRGSGRQMSGALVDGLLLDCGAGTTARLYDAALYDSVEAVLISHLHTDHLAGLFDFLLHTLISGRKRPLTVLSPPGLAPILRGMNAVGAMVKDPAELYDFRLVEDLRPDVTIGPWHVQGIPMHHTIYDLGYLLTSEQRTLFYTGDTRPPSSPDGVRADVVIHEATFADREGAIAHEYGHSTGSQAALAAARMGARQLFLTHIESREGADAEILREARAVFPETTLTEDRAQYEI